MKMEMDRERERGRDGDGGGRRGGEANKRKNANKGNPTFTSDTI